MSTRTTASAAARRARHRRVRRRRRSSATSPWRSPTARSPRSSAQRLRQVDVLRTLARLLKPTRAGCCSTASRSTRCRPATSPAGCALLPQSPIAPDGLLVRDLVGRGRHPHQRWFRQWSHEDEEIVEAALALTDTADLRDRPLDQLSGGQRQRAWIAMTLAQDTELMLLDEPTTYLDLAHQVEVLDLVARLNRERGRTVAMVLHDLNLAARYSDVVIVLKDGAVVAQGDPARGVHRRAAARGVRPRGRRARRPADRAADRGAASRRETVASRSADQS